MTKSNDTIVQSFVCIDHLSSNAKFALVSVITATEADRRFSKVAIDVEAVRVPNIHWRLASIYEVTSGIEDFVSGTVGSRNVGTDNPSGRYGLDNNEGSERVAMKS